MLFPSAISRWRRHSSWSGDSATYGGRTRSLGAGVSPDSPNSLVWRGHSPDVRTMASSSGSLTTFATNSFVSRMLRSVSLGSSWRSPMAMATSGGSLEIALKYENGAKFGTPLALTVDTNAIGRGTTAEMRNRYTSRCGSVRGSRIMPATVAARGARVTRSQVLCVDHHPTQARGTPPFDR